MKDGTQQVRTSRGLTIVAALVVIIAGMSAAKSIVVPFLLSAFIAIVSGPSMFWLQRKGLPKWLSLIAVVFCVLLIGVLMAGLVGASVKDFSRNLPTYEAKLKQQTASAKGLLRKVGVEPSRLALSRAFNPASVMKATAALLNALAKSLANAFLILMTVIFMLLEASTFPAKLAAIVGKGQSSKGRFDSFIANVKQYMVIKTIVSLATGLLVIVWLLILGVDYPLLWGMLAFCLNYVPNIGSMLAALPAVMLAVIQYDPIRALFVALGYLAINLTMGNAVEPRFMGKGLGLSTLVVFLSLVFWGWVLGPVGMLLSVPLTITAKIALDSREDTRWISILLGPEANPQSDSA